jgi:FkbM family methyltransferase
LIKKIYNFLHIFHNIYFKNQYLIPKKTYSLLGEDLVVKNFFKNLKKGLYVDIGCHNPLRMNNTQLLYQKGWRGINVDVGKFSIDLFNFLRPDDLNYHCAVSNKNKNVILYFNKEYSPLSSIKKNFVNKRIKGILKKKKIKGFRLDDILSWGKYKNKQIDFLDIDVEGADLEVLEGLNFKKYNPKIICIEIHKKNYKHDKIFNFLIKKRYRLIWHKKFSFIFISKRLDAKFFPLTTNYHLLKNKSFHL